VKVFQLDLGMGLRGAADVAENKLAFTRETAYGLAESKLLAASK